MGWVPVRGATQEEMKSMGLQSKGAKLKPASGREIFGRLLSFSVPHVSAMDKEDGILFGRTVENPRRESM